MNTILTIGSGSVIPGYSYFATIPYAMLQTTASSSQFPLINGPNNLYSFASTSTTKAANDPLFATAARLAALRKTIHGSPQTIGPEATAAERMMNSGRLAINGGDEISCQGAKRPGRSKPAGHETHRHPDAHQTIFGYPIYRGLEEAIGNERFKKEWRDRTKEWLEYMHAARIGSLVHNCWLLNIRVEGTEPVYRRVGRRGSVLIDVEIKNERGGYCSMRHCGVGLPFTKEQAETNRRNILSHPSAKKWGWDKLYAEDNMTINEDGTFSIKSPSP